MTAKAPQPSGSRPTKVRKTADKRSMASKSEKERRERDSIISRISNEYKLFNKINQTDTLSIINKMYEPTKVVLDTKYDRTSTNKRDVKQNDPKKDKKGVREQVTSVLSSENSTKIFTLDKLQAGKPRTFEQLPISSRTKKGLEEAGYRVLTKIQHATMTHTLARRDLMAVSCTGSGKTLAFVIPVLESLWQQNWDSSLGLGAIIIEPTRELALQTFHTIRRVGKYHDFSAAMLIGGTSFEEERKGIGGMNILVCTPGRLMHHLEQSYSLDVSNVITVVLDEADHLLDLGFMDQLDALLPILPKPLQFNPSNLSTSVTQTGRHTMLFSATSNKQVELLTQKVLGIQPYKIALGNTGDDTASNASGGGNPLSLRHNYVIIPEIQKVDALFSFLRLHCSNKVLVFVSTTRQATFLYETFRIFSVSMPVLRLHSKLSAANRMQIYNEFQQHKNGVLICTDIASRGLDITGVSWVVHFDCPESVDQYIHRSGRTARMSAKGQNLLLLTPSQQPFISLLGLHPSSKNTVKMHEVTTPPPIKKELHQHFVSLFSTKPLFRNHAEKALISYIQHVLYNYNKYSDIESDSEEESDVDDEEKPYNFKKEAKLWESIFDPSNYDMYGLSYAHGLTAVPVIDMGDSDSDSDDQEAATAQKKVAEQKKTKESMIDEDGADELHVTQRTNPLFIQFNQKLKKINKLEKMQQQTHDNEDDLFVPTTHTSVIDDDFYVNFNTPSTFTLQSFNSMIDLKTVLKDDDEDRLELLQQRYKTLDLQDKQYSKDLAVKKRKFTQNLRKLEKLKAQGIHMTMEELEQSIADGALKNINKQANNGDVMDYSENDSEMDIGVNSDDEMVPSHLNTMMLNETSDGESSDDENVAAIKKATASVKLGQSVSHYKKLNAMLNESSDDSENDSDNDVSLAYAKLKQVQQKATPVRKIIPTTPAPSKKYLHLSESSDDSDDEKPVAKVMKRPTPAPVPAKKHLNLDETSDDESDDMEAYSSKKNQATQMADYDSDNDSDDNAQATAQTTTRLVVAKKPMVKHAASKVTSTKPAAKAAAQVAPKMAAVKSAKTAPKVVAAKSAKARK